MDGSVTPVIGDSSTIKLHHDLEVENDNLINENENEDTINEESSSTSSSSQPKDHKALKVVARIRPPIRNEPPLPSDGQSCIVKVKDAEKIQATNPRDGVVTYHDFDSVLGPEATQNTCFQAIEKDVQETLEGIPLLLMAYGVTSAGKTYTLFGDLVSNIGSESNSRSRSTSRPSSRSSSRGTHKTKLTYTQLLQQLGEGGYVKSNIEINEKLCGLVSAKQCGLFGNTVNKLMTENENLASEIKQGLVEVRVSAIQIYNGIVMDLLRLASTNLASANSSSSSSLHPQSRNEDDNDHILQVFSTTNPIPNRSWRPCKTAEEVLKVTKMALLCREVSATAVNATSSRSHCWVTIAIEPKSPKSKQCSTHLSFLDLAGSEPSSAALSQKEHSEGNNIRLDLFAIGNILTALKKSNNLSVSNAPSFRQSALTLLLRPYLQLVQVEAATREHPSKFMIPSNVIMFMNFHTREDGFAANKEALQLGLVASSIKSYADTQPKYMLERKNAAAMVSIMAEATQNAQQNNGILTPRLNFSKKGIAGGILASAAARQHGLTTDARTPTIGGTYRTKQTCSDTPKIDALMKNLSSFQNSTIQLSYEDWCEILKRIEYLSNQLTAVVNEAECTVRTQRLMMHTELTNYMEQTIEKERAVLISQIQELEDANAALTEENSDLLKKVIEYVNKSNDKDKEGNITQLQEKLNVQLTRCPNCVNLERQLTEIQSTLSSTQWRYKTMKEESLYITQENKRIKDEYYKQSKVLEETQKENESLIAEINKLKKQIKEGNNNNNINDLDSNAL